MEKHYFIKNRSNNSIYHFDLSRYDIIHRYDFDLQLITGQTPYCSNEQCYQYLVYLLSVISGFNQRNKKYKNLKQCLHSVGFNNLRMSEDILYLDEHFTYIGSTHCYLNLVL